MKPFLTEYHYTKLMMPFMYDDLDQLLRYRVAKYNKPGPTRSSHTKRGRWYICRVEAIS